MRIKAFKSLSNISMFIVLFALSTSNYASGPGMEVLEQTIEQSRITVSTEDSDTKGTLTIQFIECNDCDTQTYHFDNNTILINPMGAERPIKELQSWSGNKAMVRYRKADGHVNIVKILP